MSEVSTSTRSATRWRLVSPEEYRGLTDERNRDLRIAAIQARMSSVYDILVSAQLELSRLQGELMAVSRAGRA